MAIIGTADYRSMQEKRYTNGTKELIAEIARRLERQNIPFSGRINGNYGTITVSGDENKRIVDAMAESLKTSFTRQPRTERRIIGNTDFRYIPKKVITSVDPAIADTLENTLKANNIPYSGVVVTNGDSQSTKITVSADNKPLLDRYADEAVRSIGVIAQLQDRGYSFDTSKGISVSYNGETLHYDTVAAFMSAYQSIDNGFFHPADYRVIRSVNDEGQPVYTLAEYSKDTGAPKNNGNTEEFYSVSSVERFIEENRNRINILTTADELQSFREMDMELMREQLVSRNRELYSSIDSLSYVLRFNEDGTGTLVYTDLGDIVQLTFDENAVRMAYEFASEYTEDIFTDTQQQRARVSVWLDGLEEYADVKTISDDSEEYEAYINYIKGAESSGNKLYLLDDDRSDGISLVDEIEGHYPEVTARKILDGYLSMNEQERAAFVSERENRTWENTNSTEYQLYDTIRRDINSQNPSVDFETAMGMWEQGIELKDAEGRVLTAEDGMPDILSSQIVHASAENKALYLGAVRFAHEIEDINESVVRTSPDSDLLDFMAQYAPDRYTGSFVISEEALEDYIKGNTAVYADWKEEIRELSLPDELKERIENLNIPIDDTSAVEEQTATVDLTEALAQIEALRRERDQWEAQAKANAAAAEDYRRQAGKFGDKQETTFAEQIHEVLHGTPNRYDDLKVCDTPKILQYIGCDDLPMLYTKEHLRKAVKPKDVHKHQHGLTEEFLATVPELMAEPVMVLDSMTRDDSLLVVLSSKETDPDNAPIVASVFPNGQGKYEMQLMPSNFVTSIYGRDNFETFINKCAEEDKILFADKEKSQELFSVLRLQFPQGFNNLSFNTIIHPSRNIVKPFVENISDNEQISEPKYRRQLREQSTEKSFEEQVDDVLAGKTNRYEDIKVCDTPKVLRDIGLDYLPMFYSQNHLRKAVAERNDAAHKHGLSVEQVKRMAELLADPAMVLDSITRDDTVIAVTDMLDDKNAPVIISIRPNGKGHYELEEVDSNFVTSMYGKDNFESFLNRTIEQDKVLYVSKEKSQELFRVLTLQLGKGVNSLDFTNLGSDIIIHQSRNIVKGSGENISENEQTAGRAVSEDVIEIETDGTSKAYFIDRTSAEIDREIDIPQLSQEDIEILRQLEPRKSVLNFTDEEMKLTEKWQERFAEIGEKSPYYRLQNGDWRENEQARVKILRVADHGRDFKGVRDDIKNGTINRGEFINADTGWTIQVSRHGLEDSVKYGVAKKDADTFNLMYHINELVENSVLLDSTVSDDNKQSKAFNTAFMHKMYSPVIIGETPYLAKLTVEEFGNSATKDTQRRLYNVRDIKIEPAENIGFTNESLARSFSESSDMSISDLYTLVKSFDEDFYLNKRTSEKEIQEERTETKETETEQLDLFSMPPEKTEEAPKQAREETTAQNEWHTVPDVSDDEGNPLEWAKKLDDGSFVWIDKEVYPDGTQFAVYNTSSHEFPPLETFATLEMAQEYVDEELNRSQEKHDFTITSDDFNTTHGQKNRFRQNVEAIRTLKQIEGENRLATPEEQQILSGYVGWGGIPEAFDSTKENWQEEYSELKELLTDDEYAAARASVTNAHYTSPIVIEAMYTALQNMGFEGGKVLDPSMGTGNFEGKMPEEMREKSRITGVELDSITGRMAKQLYQSADVQIKGFENTNFADNSFDVAISNVPFGNYKVFDKDYLKQNFAIHNYFFAKSLDKVHPGGIVAFVTSQYTMDSTDTKVREYLAQRAELLGAIRLPMGAFRDIAGTDVGTDIIFLQKRERPIKTNDTWIEKGQTEDGIPVNAYFAEHPEMVLGNLQMGKSMYGSESVECVPIEGADLKEQLAGAIQNIQGEYRTAAKAHEESRKIEREAGKIPAPSDLKFNSYAVVNDKLYLYDSPDGTMREVTEKELAKNLIPRAKDMVKLRDQTNALLDLERDNVGGIYDDAVELEMEKLNKLYDDFVAKHGRLTDKQNIKAFERDSSLLLVRGLEKTDSNGEFAGKADVFTKQTIRGAVVADHVDNAYDAYVLSMNEKMHVDFDYMTKISGLSKEQLISDLGDKLYQDPAQNMEWVSADEYLTGNVRQKLREAQGAGLERNISALEKVQPEWIEAVNIDAKLGAPWIDEKYIKQFASELLGVNYYDRQKLKVEYEPVTGEWKVERPSNLNFNAAEIYGLPKNSRYNAYALLQMTLNNQTATVKVDVLDEYGQPRFDDKGNKLRVIDKEQTDLARVKQDNLREAFAKWVFEDPERRRALTEKYNNTYNAVRLREFDGSNFNFVGMNSAVNLMPHQKNAILRSLSGGNTLLAHEVGAGKSFEMSAIAMEGKRLGLHNKALIVVPNHLTTQMGKEFSTLYPSARLLVATEKDFRKENRDALYTKIAFGDYDAIVMGHSQFDRVHLNSTTEERWLRKQIDDLRTYLNGMRAKGDGDRLSVKKIEGQVKTLEEKLKKLLDQSKNIKDDFIEFEKLGIDKLFIDESQAYKNRSVATKLSNVAGLGGQGAMRSELLAMKIAYLNEKGGTVTFASGTPISNSITEMYTVMDYLEPDKLKKMNINNFDDWVRIFATPKTEMELKPTGNGQYQDRTRLKFSNLPELMTAFKEVADIKTAETLNLERPDAVEKTIVAEPSREQLKYIRDLGRRAEKIHKEGRKIDPKVDNMLKITSEGRKCGLDMRLLDPNAKDDPNSKVNLCIDNVFRIWEDTSERNGTQLIFCDMSTPKEPPNENIYTVYRKGESSYQAMYSENTKQSVTVDAIYEKLTQKPSEEFFTDTSGLQEGDIIVKRNVFPDEKKAYNTALIVENGQTRELAPEEWEQLHLSPIEDYEHQKSFCVYDDIKEKLIAKGVPEEQIAFIHDAANPQEAQQLYEKMNKGEIRVMIGSSTKCGAGMNAQNKMVALHHLDAPFRPSDIGQRNGRIQRRGNENKEVEIYKYVTNRTFDAYIYQLLENKQKFISAVMTEKSPVRTCDDVDEVVLSFAETKACCAGNPDILRQVQLDREIKGLQTRLAEYQSSKYRMQDSIVNIPGRIQSEQRVIEKINADIELAKSAPMEVYHRNEKTGREDKEYPLTIKGVKYIDRQSGAEALKTFIDRNITAIQSGYTVDIGEYRGFKLAMYADPLDNLMDTRQPKFILKGNSEHYCNISFDDRAAMNYAQLNRCIENMDREKEYHTERIAELKAELDGIQKKIDIPFEHQQELDTLQAELKEVNERLRRSADASDINSGFIYEWLVEMCPEICSGEDIYVKYEAADPDSRWTEESGGLEPVFIETAGNQLMLGQTYKQNGDVMYDPLITMELNHDSKTVKLLSYENSGLGKYEKFVSEVEGIDENGNVVMNIKENKQGMESCGDFICDTMMPNIQAFNYTRITPEPKGSLAAPEQVKRKAI